MERVVYLFGAGASHACVTAVGSRRGILMRDLGPDLYRKVRALVEDEYDGDVRLTNLVNSVVDEDSDYEHIITFLDESVSKLHRSFAQDLRKIFETVLRERLAVIQEEQGGELPVGLYAALLDMYEVDGFQEVLAGMLTLNYDEFVEIASQSTLGRRVDLGVTPVDTDKRDGPTLLKLHGSFDWHESWPIKTGAEESPLWIPPGIQKAKDRYPFNVLWGLARELLDCDVLRIIGCQLGPNDWDLISLLFTTRHTGSSGSGYRIEVIDAPEQADRLQQDLPYLQVDSILEAEPVGKRIISEFIGGGPRRLSSLGSDERQRLLDRAKRGENWFRLWLTHMAEILYTELDSIDTDSGVFKRFMET